MIYTSAARDISLVNEGVQNNPFAAWENKAAGKTYGGTTALAAGPAANAFAPGTYNYWLPDVTTTSATLTVDMGAAVSARFMALEAHNVGTLGATVAAQHSPDGTTWTDCGAGSATPDDDRALAWRLADISRRYWRWSFTGLTSGDPLAVGVAFIGEDMVFPRRFYQGFAPVITPTEVQLQSSVSVGGNLLGSTVVVSGSTMQASFQNIPAAFVRGDDFKSMMRAFNRGFPMFFAWRPLKYGQDLHYIWRDGATIRPDNAGPRDLMAFGIEARVYEG